MFAEMYLIVVNSEIGVQAQANFTLCALTFGRCMFVFGYAHSTTIMILQWPTVGIVLQVRSFDWHMGLVFHLA
jgi:hypothetical protein